ncbi:MAG TPA: formyltransferase family protein [Allosphingosinicella sp.]|jgi:methionyl-tRNA formyltransferase
MKYILLAKQDHFSRQAVTLAEAIFGEDVTTFTGKVGDPFPEAVRAVRPRALISFLSPWIVRQDVLENAEIAINFHPASTDYPGLGCYNFALYEDAPEFGAVCHHMLAKVDTGRIVEERRFTVLPNDSVESLKLRTMVTMVSMFHDICSKLASDLPLPEASVHWSRRPFTGREMNALKIIDPEMPAEEIARRIRATVYPGYDGPSVTIGGKTFFYPVPNRTALA